MQELRDNRLYTGLVKMQPISTTLTFPRKRLKNKHKRHILLSSNHILMMSKIYATILTLFQYHDVLLGFAVSLEIRKPLGRSLYIVSSFYFIQESLWNFVIKNSKIGLVQFENLSQNFTRNLVIVIQVGSQVRPVALVVISSPEFHLLEIKVFSHVAEVVVEGFLLQDVVVLDATGAADARVRTPVSVQVYGAFVCHLSKHQPEELRKR